MRVIVDLLLVAVSCLATSALPAPQEMTQETTQKIDAVVSSMYESAASVMPCKISTHSGSHMMSWQKVDKCLSGAMASVDWAATSKELAAIRPRSVSEDDFAAAVEASLTRHAMPYSKVFQVKDQKALLPLTNSVLKYLVPDVLAGLPVLDQTGKVQVGTFTSTFVHEAPGGLSTAKTFPLVMFQYKDPQGKVQTASEKPLLDTYGVPWQKVAGLIAYRLTSDKLPNIAGR